MKRLLLIIALALPTWLYSCMPKAIVPTPATVIEQAHEAFPKAPLPEPPYVILPSDPNVQPVKPKATKKHNVRPAAPKVRPPARKAPVVPVPPQVLPPKSAAPLLPQAGVICIFPLNTVPHCTPEPAGRMP